MNLDEMYLCVDQAAVSGWSIVVPSVTSQLAIVDHGTATNFAARRVVMTQLLEHARRRNIKPSNLRLVLEDHSKNSWGKASAATMVGTGKAYGRWEEQWLFHGLVHAHVHAVPAATWRGSVLGSGKGGEVAREAAKKRARMVLGVEVDEDEAEAVCIGVYAAQHMDRIIAGLGAPKRERKKRRKAAA